MHVVSPTYRQQHARNAAEQKQYEVTAVPLCARMFGVSMLRPLHRGPDVMTQSANVRDVGHTCNFDQLLKLPALGRFR